MARLEKTSDGFTYKKDRGWGYELWYENLPEYCGKLLHIYKGKRGSLHFHINKLETMLLKMGHVKLRFIDPSDGSEYFVELFTGDTVRIPRGQVHQIIAMEESEIIEFSTIHEEDDSHRVQKGD